MAADDFWLYQWLDSYLVKSPREARKLLQQKSSLKTLRDTIAEAADKRIAVDQDRRPVIVAGSGLDLSGQLDCTHHECLMRQVNTLLRSVWHYFDRIVIVGPSARWIDSMWDSDEALLTVLPVLDSYIQLLLYLRNIGAENLLIFTEKPDRWCEVHGEPLFRQIGVESSEALEAYLSQLTEQIAKESVVEIEDAAKAKEHLGHCFVSVYHPEYFDKPSTHLIRVHPGSQLPDKRTIIERTVREYVGHLLSDIDLSQHWQAPLGSSVKFHERLLRDRSPRVTESEVALHLKLPVLQGADLETLIRIREEERAHFEAFRSSIRLAIRERLLASSSSDPQLVAREIEQDIIAPALTEIERRLSAARSVLAKKSVTGVGVGFVTATCGLLTGNPLLVTTGVGAAMTTLAAVNKYFEEQRDIALSDMYFVWRGRTYEQRQ
jgi:hypothetical protein